MALIADRVPSNLENLIERPRWRLLSRDGCAVRGATSQGAMPEDQILPSGLAERSAFYPRFSSVSLSLSQLKAFPWIVCDRASLRPCDLADAFLGAADSITELLSLPRPDGETPAGLSRSSALLCQALAVDSSSLVAEEASLEALEALEELSNWLESRSPAGFCFGASEGDGKLFGFFLSSDWEEALEERGLSSLLDSPEDCALLIQEAEDLGLSPDTFCDGFQGEAEGYSEEEAGTDFAQELAESIGEVHFLSLPWPQCCIDWKEAWQLLEDDGFSLAPSSWSARWWVLRAV